MLNLSRLKKFFAIQMYKYDIKQYGKLLDILYLQTMKMAEYLPNAIANINIKALPPGANYNNEKIEKRKKHFEKKSNDLNIFYVGGIGVLYDLEPLLKVANKKEYIHLTICCRREDWEKEKLRYEKYLNNRIVIVHKSGKELEEYYENTDICNLYFTESEYRTFVLPIKLFEYLENVTPILAMDNTEAGKFVSKNKIGWSVSNEEGKLSELLDEINMNKELLKEKHKNAINVLKDNMWTTRAQQVIDDLTK